MLNHLVSRAAARLLALAMLLTIAVHAVQPIGPAFQIRHGSAFSAATAEVAVTPPQREAPARPAPALEPPNLAIPVVSAVAVVPTIDAGLFFPEATGPPMLRPLARGPSPRAPPSA